MKKRWPLGASLVGLTKIPMEAISLMRTHMIIHMVGHLINLEADNKHLKKELKKEDKQMLIGRNSQLRKFKKRQIIKPKNSKNLNKTCLIHLDSSKILEVCSGE